RRQGFVNVYAGIALPNPASVALHEWIGMRLVGVYEGVGFKFGVWHDVAWYGLRLAEPAGIPPEPISLPELV
ncbi:MAG: N-acetyltransferase, partial [Candidatus Limnocylindria bacterium]